VKPDVISSFAYNTLTMLNEILPFLPANIWGWFLLLLIFILGLIALFKIKKTEYIIYGLLIWLPLESLVLRYTPIDYYSYVKYLPEVLLYSVVFGAWLKYVKETGRLLPKLIINKWLIGLLISALISLLLNWYSPVIWLLGLRQLLRFVSVLFLILFLNYPRETLQKFLKLGLVMMTLEMVLAIIQYLSGGSLDNYLFSTQVVNVGGNSLLSGLEQTWAPGSRVFATMGRYDILGSFLALGILAAFPWLYSLKDRKFWPWLFFCLAIIALFLTASRASWLALIVGIVAVGIFVLKDKRILKFLILFLVCAGIYLFSFALVKQNLAGITERSNQTVAERVFEAVSWRAWRESYYGYGRIFFIVNTPRLVVASAPIFGVGPGNYGGGVAAALLNDSVYNRLHLPFGIQNIYGQIDNSWFSLWGEYGTLGLILWLTVFMVLLKYCYNVWQNSENVFEKNLALGLFGATLGVMVVGFFGPYFEFRALMFYYWVLVGVSLSFQSVKIF